MHFRIAGSIGAVSALLASVADLFSGYAIPPRNQMSTAYSVTLESVTPLLLLKQHGHLVAGHYLAILFIPVGIFGIWHVYLALRPAGEKKALAFLVGGTLSYAMGAAFHSTFGFVASILQSGDDILIAKTADFFEPLGLLLLISMVLLLLWLTLLILSGKTLYPRWAALFTPLVFQLLFSSLGYLLPIKIGVAFLVMGLNLALSCFFTVSLLLLWNKVPDERTA
ncbi:MAG: hypothetical protein BMS9Abin37_0326 [Acidobacteriota bacterium]|nr:MAG: hypothetical protein BMS9Abin37_0326 [Acidobacteriota bacterium]